VAPGLRPGTARVQTADGLGYRQGMPSKLAVVLIVLALAASCATYKATLTNSKGQTTTCEASGKGCGVKDSFDQCVASARAQGYSEGPAPTDAGTK
jgi:hypothetical protein